MLNHSPCYGAILALLFLSGVSKAQNQIVSVSTYGAFSDGSNAAATTSAFQQAVLAAGINGKVTVPPGQYAIDNSNGPLVFNNFGGEFKFEGNAALIFSTPANAGLQFSAGTGLRVVGFHSKYLIAPTAAVTNAPALGFFNTSSTILSEATIENSPGAAIYFSNAAQPKVANIITMSSLAEGVRFDNCLSAEITNAQIMNSGTDGLVIYTGAGNSANAGAHATNISVTGSGRRGISVVGSNQVTIGAFHVNASGSSSIFCGTGTGSDVPDHVQFEGGVITAGSYFGIEFQNQNSCAFANIDIDTPGGRGVSGTAPTGSVQLRNIRVRNNLQGDAFNFTGVQTVMISDSAAENSPGYGFFFESVSRAVVTGVTTLDVSKASSLQRAVWFQHGGTVVASNVEIDDDQVLPSGLIIGTTGMSRGVINGVSSLIASGTLQVLNLSPGVTVSLIN